MNYIAAAINTSLLLCIVYVNADANCNTHRQADGITEKTRLIQMAEIPAGFFYMGGNGWGADYDEAPIHKVIISKPFRMGKTEITNAQFEAFDPTHKARRGKYGISVGDDEAAIDISYDEAVKFCEWLSIREKRHYRLPTEAEWEYACKAGTYTLYYTGDGLPESFLKDQTIVRDYKQVRLDVGKTAPNAFGLYDMHGNVEEWCLDWYGPYTEGNPVDPAGPENGIYKVTRGGSHSTPVKYLRSTNRMAMIPEDRNCLVGFRIVESDTPLNYSKVLTFPGQELNSIERLDENVTDHGKSSVKVTTAKASARPFFMAPVPFVIQPSYKDFIETNRHTQDRHEDKTDILKNFPFYRHNHQPAITWCDNGDLLAIWFSADEENGREMVVLGSRLEKGKQKWPPAEVFFKVPDRNMTGSSLLNDGRGTLYHFNGVEAAGDWQNLAMIMRKSTDNGYSWSRPEIIGPEHTRRHQVIAGPIITRDGRIIQLCDAGPGSQDGSSIHISRDKGDNWYDPWDGSGLPDFREEGKGTTIAGIHAGIVELNDGRLMALGRGNSIDGKDGKPHMPMSISSDGGKTWTYHASPFPPIDGGQRLVLMRLNEGPILLVSFTDHPQRTPEKDRGMEFNGSGRISKGYGMYAALSFDDGKTWPIRKLITDGTYRFLDGGAWTGFFEMDRNRAEPRGYLAGVQEPDGTINILSSRLHYRFNLAWLTN